MWVLFEMIFNNSDAQADEELRKFHYLSGVMLGNFLK